MSGATNAKRWSRLSEMGAGKRQAADNLFAAGDALCHPYVREGVVDIDDETLCHQVMPLFTCNAPGCQEVFDSLLDFDQHYKSRHKITCSQCHKPSPSAHLLDLHISETHDSFFAAQAERKPMFRCFVEQCGVVSGDAVQRRAHCIEAHAFPPDFRYDESHKKKKKDGGTDKAAGSEKMAVDEVTKRLNKFTFGHSRSKMFSGKIASVKKSTNRNGTSEKSSGESSAPVPEQMES